MQSSLEIEYRLFGFRNETPYSSSQLLTHCFEIEVFLLQGYPDVVAANLCKTFGCQQKKKFWQLCYQTGSDIKNH